MNGHVTVNENYNIIVVSNENTKGSFPETRRLCASRWEKMAGKSKCESVVSLASGIAVTKRYLRQIWQTKCTKSNETSSLLPAGLPGTARLLPQDLLSRVVCPR